ncbi:MAG: hypothetical protein Q9218_002886 [Villophora microphyllina]
MANEEDEQGFKRMWEDAQHRFEQKTKKSLVQQKNPSLENVLKKLDERFNDDNPDSGGKQQRVKQLASNVLKLIQLLGGIAAQGASIVFGPATQCFSAIDFLLDIPARISRFHDDLARLFAEISTFLQVFKIYQRIEDFTTVNVELKRSTHKLMILFVDICALSIDYFSGSRFRKILSDAKLALFEDDVGVKAKLEEFKILIGHQGQISDAVTLEHVLRSEQEQKGSLKKVLDMLKKSSDDTDWKLHEVNEKLERVDNNTNILAKYATASNNQKEQQDRIEQICKTLSVEATAIDELVKKSLQIQISSQEYTGSWLEDIDVYKSWTDLESKCDPTLWLCGDSGTGKSHLAFTIINGFMKRYSSANSKSMRVSAAFYRYVRNDKRPRDDIIKYSLRCIAAQLAKQNTVYMKKLSSHLESIDPSTVRQKIGGDLFRELIHPPNMNDMSDIAYVLLFDGIDQLSEDEAHQLAGAIHAMKTSTVRILMTGTADNLRFCSDSTGQTSGLAPHINVAERNLPDIERFVDCEIKRCNALHGDRDEVSRIVAKVREDLPTYSKGNFKDAEQIIGQVSDAVESELTEEEIEDIISGKTLKDVQSLINELSDTLNAQETGQLNELLIWTLYGYQLFNVEEMEAALFMRTSRKPFQPLRKKVGEKYRSILEIDPDNDCLRMKNGDFEDFFWDSIREPQSAGKDTEEDPKISMTVKIDHVSRSHVQRFFWDLSEKVVLDKFAFTAPTTGPEPKAKISANMTEAHLTIAKRCFDLLLDEPNEETKILGGYALQWLPAHLKDLRRENNEGFLRPAEKEEIVESLISLLQSPDTVETHLNEKFLRSGGWLNESEADAIGGWLEDSEATSELRRSTDKLRRKERSWLKRVDLGGWLLALNDIAKMIACQWLCYRTFPAPSLFDWIDIFLTRVAEKQGQDCAAEESESSGANQTKADQELTNNIDIPAEDVLPTQARVLRAAKWAEKEAGTTKDSLYYERLGYTYLGLQEHDCSIAAFVKAKDLPNSSWTVSNGLAEAYSEASKKDLAVKEMDLAIASLRSKGSAVDGTNDLVSNLYMSAMLHKDLKHTAESIDQLREAIQLDAYHYESYYQLLRVLIDSNAESEAFSLLNEMDAEPAKELKLTRLGAMLIEFLDSNCDLERFQTIFHMTRHDNLFNVILQTLERIIAFAPINISTSKGIVLRHAYGVALAGYSIQEKHLDSALSQWRKCCELGILSQAWEDWDEAYQAAKRIFVLHLATAKSAQSSADDIEVCSTELNDLVERIQMRYPWVGFRLRLLLASFHKSIGRQKEAHELLLNDMKSGFDLLSDDDPGNDWVGYSMIADILMHTGDDLNALSAWSLRGPSERYGASIDFPSTPTPCECDVCDKPVLWGDGIWFCKMCYWVGFHDGCLPKLRSGQINRYICSQDHDWLHVPSWIDEYKATGDGKVHVGGEIQDGQRVEGHIVPIEEWLDTVREKWGIEKFTPVIHIEEGY